MTKMQQFMLFSLLILIFTLYTFWENKQNKKNIIKPIKIEPIIIKKDILPNNIKSVNPSEILLKLKLAVKKMPKDIITKKEQVIKTPSKTTITIKVNKDIIIIKKDIAKIKKDIAKIAKQIEIKKQIITVVTSTQATISPSIKQKYPQVKKKYPSVIKIANKKFIQEKEVKKLKRNRENKTFSREIEVAQYQNKYSNDLEVIANSEIFELEIPSDSLPDAYYFENVQEMPEEHTNIPLNFVKKLGIVNVSNQYESDFYISEKIELAEEGIVNISTSSEETEEIKNLKFVHILDIVEVSPIFETIEAQNYLY